MPNALFKASIREAILTVLPITVNSIRSGDPMLPTTTRPLLIPIPTWMGCSPRLVNSELRCSNLRCKSCPAAKALSA